MKINLIIEGQCPSGKNNVTVTRTGKRFPNARFVKWRDEALSKLKKQWKPNTGFELKRENGPKLIFIQYTPGDHRRRDMPGIIDAVWHLLEKAGIVLDDWKLAGMPGQSLAWFVLPTDKQNPQVELDLYY